MTTERNPPKEESIAVRIRKPGLEEPAGTLNAMLSWLESEKIYPLHFQYFPCLDGGYAFYFLLRSQKDADRLTEKFGKDD